MIDPQAPFIAQDGYYYQDFAAYLLGEPAHCYRNSRIKGLRREWGEDVARAWREAYDSVDNDPGDPLGATTRADEALDLAIIGAFAPAFTAT